MKKQDLPSFLKMNLLNEFLYVMDFPQDKLMELATYILSQSDKWHKIYWLQGDLRGEYYPSFHYIRINPRLVLKDGKLYTETHGLIYPQDKPIILVIENFHSLEEHDQYAYSFLFRTDDAINLHLHPESLVIVGRSQDSKLNISDWSRWTEFEDDK
jgi:hypothetical protein